MGLADRGYWAGAASHFVEAEKGFQHARDPENELYARIGRLRATADQQMRPLPLIAAEIAHELATNPILEKNARIRMFAFEVKGDIDGESNTSAMRQDFAAMNKIAKQLGDEKAENRSLMFLGLTAFYDGDLNTARDNVAKALNVATRIGDKPTQMMCLSMLGKGLADTGLPEQGLQMIDRALRVAATIPDAGYPYITNSFKIGALIGVRRPAEAEGLSNEMLRRATLDSRAVWQVTALTQLAAVYRASERVAQSRTMLLRALELAKTAELTRLRGEVEGELAAAFLQTGELEHAENHASEAAISTQKAGDLITLPQVLGKLAQIQKLRGNMDAAMIDANFGRTLNTFDRTSLVRTSSGIYTNHFSLLAERGADVGTLFRFIETTRARALADLLASSRPKEAEFEGPERHIAKLRLGLMQARTNSRVRSIRDQILNAEQDRWIAPGVGGLGSLKSELSLENL